jgi:protein-disulfide isomerase
MHSPVLGPQGAPVTIVEFFDPACETCHAFYPIGRFAQRESITLEQIQAMVQH